VNSPIIFWGCLENMHRLSVCSKDIPALWYVCPSGQDYCGDYSLSFSTKMGQKPLRDSPLGCLLQSLQTLGLTEILSLNWVSTDTNINWTIITIDKNRTFSISKFSMISKTSSTAMENGLRNPYI
jgi:hypothetical protein